MNKISLNQLINKSNIALTKFNYGQAHHIHQHITQTLPQPQKYGDGEIF
jgi:hypothetical protein